MGDLWVNREALDSVLGGLPLRASRCLAFDSSGAPFDLVTGAPVTVSPETRSVELCITWTEDPAVRVTVSRNADGSGPLAILGAAPGVTSRARVHREAHGAQFFVSATAPCVVQVEEFGQ